MKAINKRLPLLVGVLAAVLGMAVFFPTRESEVAERANSFPMPSITGDSPHQPRAATNTATSAGATPTLLESSAAASSSQTAVNPVNATPRAGRPIAPPRGVSSSSASSYALKQKSASLAVSLSLQPPAVPVAEILAGRNLSNPAERASVVAELSAREQERMNTVLARASDSGVPLRVDRPNGGVAVLYGFRGEEPIYRITLNADAAISSAANLIRPSPYNLSGAARTVGVWDAGSVLGSHQEFSGRVTLRNPAIRSDDHATHVAGTIIAAGVQAKAKGMAPAGLVDSYDWNNDIAEMTAAGSTSATDSAGIGLSNHSYGYGASTSDMGRYDSFSEDLDAVGFALPFYLQFWAAGNEQKEYPVKNGFQSITRGQLAKNILTVGAVNDAVTAGARDLAKATMSSFSSWGPCDDGRIKPDVVANGVQLYSPIDRSSTSYASYQGTSMASPSAAGSALLLAELYAREFPATPNMRASLLKALLIHTADDLGTPGPDYKFGWGLINAKTAADVILAHKTKPAEPKFYEGEITAVLPTRTVNFTWDGINPIRATLCWTDPAGTPQSAPDSRTPNLVHNLDVQIAAPDGTTITRPFVMPFVGTWTDASMSAAATTGKNNADNVEQVLIRAANGVIGTYTLTISLDGSLTTAAQAYSLVLSGAGDPVNPPPVVSLNAPSNGAVIPPDSTVTLRATASDLSVFGEPGEVTQVEFLANGTVLATIVAEPYEFVWSPGFGNYDLQARATDNEGELAFSAPVNVEVRYPLPGEVVGGFNPPSADNVVRALSSDGLGRIYIGGAFTALEGTFSSPRVARLGPDGTPDRGFLAGAGFDADVRVLLHSEPARGLYVGGAFTTYQGQPRVALARLTVGQTGLADALPDAAFAPVLTGVNPVVNAIVEQYDGKVVIGGSFSSVNGTSTPNLARLNPDGSVDPSFTPPAPGGTVNALALQPDGKILLGGAFTQVAGQTRRGLARLNLDGTLDTTLGIGTGLSSGFNGTINSVAVAPDGVIYAGGQFSSYNGRTFYNNLVKLSASGAIDGRFNYSLDASGGLNSGVNNVQVRPTGEVLVSGLFTQFSRGVPLGAPTAVGRIVQLKPDGSIDPAFNPAGTGANNTLHTAVTMGNGDLLLVGAFSSFNAQPVSRIAVIAGTDGIVPLLTSGQFRTVGAGGDMDFLFTSSAVPGPVEFELVSGTLPRGVAFDSVTGRLSGIPLDAGSFALGIRPRQMPDGPAGPTVTFTLHVLSEAVPYETWRRAWFSGADLADEAVSGPAAQAANVPGLSNLAVYALSGGDPADPASTQLPSVSPEWHGGKQYWTYSVPKYRLASATYIPQISEDLAVWATENTAEAEISSLLTIDNTVDLLRVRSTKPIPQANKQFFMLRITMP